MPWLGWLRRNSRATDTKNAPDTETVLAEGLRDLQSARQSIATLERERKSLKRMRRSVLAGLKPMTPSRTRTIVRSSRGSPEMAAFQLSQEMRDVNDTGQATTSRKEQLAAVDGKIQAIDRALEELKEFVRRLQ